MSRRLLFLFCVLFLGAGPAHAQLALPGAAPAAPVAAAGSPKVKKAAGPSKRAKAAPAAAPGVAGLAGRPLLLNGKAGLLEISGDDMAVTIDKLRLAGESVSDPSQPCVVDIVGEKPIQAASVGKPDGLERFEADVSACPFAFDLLNGATLVPPQISACVFKAADCQTNPSGLWGPEGSSLQKEAANIAKERAQAEKSMGKAVRAVENRAANNPEAASLLREQGAFAGQRDDACRGYLKENVHGYCAARLTEARTALLQARLGGLGSEAAAKPEKKKKKTKKDAKAQ